MARARKANATNLKLENYSDREMLHLIDDLADEEGWAMVEHIAERVGISVAGMSDAQLVIHARRCVSIRLAWIRKLSGTVERHPHKDDLSWRLTKPGLAIVKAKLNANVDNALGQMTEANVLLALDVVSRRYLRANGNAANLMRREWAYGTHKNRRR